MVLEEQLEEPVARVASLLEQILPLQQEEVALEDLERQVEHQREDLVLEVERPALELVEELVDLLLEETLPLQQEEVASEDLEREVVHQREDLVLVALVELEVVLVGQLEELRSDFDILSHKFKFRVC